MTYKRTDLCNPDDKHRDIAMGRKEKMEKMQNVTKVLGNPTHEFILVRAKMIF